MENSLLLNSFFVATLLFFLFVASLYLVSLIVFIKDKSFGIKTDNKIIILKSWFFALNIVVFFSMMYLMKTSNSIGFICLVFLIGFSFMMLLFILTIKILTNKRFITNNVADKTHQKISEETFEDFSKIPESINESVSLFDCSVNEEISTKRKNDLDSDAHISSEIVDAKHDDNSKSTITPIVKLKEDFLLENLNDSSPTDHQKNVIFNDSKPEISNQKSHGRATQQIYHRGTDVMPNTFTDQEIEEKLMLIQNHYLMYCNTDDFKKLLVNSELREKVLFKKEDGTIANFTKKDYLEFLHFTFGGILIEHPSNKKICQWINKNFNSKNINNKEIGIKDISDLRNNVKQKSRN